MTLRWYGDEAKDDIDRQAAEGLLRGAVWFQTAHKHSLNVSNPGPLYANSSKPGEYPRARTGFGRSSHMYEPFSVAEIQRTHYVRLGYLQNAYYMAILEVFRGRKGLVATLDALKSQLATIITGG